VLRGDVSGRASAPVPGLYATIAIDASPAVARERLRRNMERYYALPLEVVQSVQAMYAGTPAGACEWLEGYVSAGARHIVVRVADEQAERGLDAAAEVRELLAAERATAIEIAL
jgi:hypothetical protein